MKIFPLLVAYDSVIYLDLSLGQEFFNGLRERLWVGGGCVAMDWDSILVYQKFGEIPFDGAWNSSWLFLFQVTVQWNGVFSVDGTLHSK